MNEKFEVKAGKASWKNKFENESVLYKGELYSNIYGNPGEMELSLKDLEKLCFKKSKYSSFRYLNYTVVKEETVKDENNNSLDVQLIGFSGLGGPPNYYLVHKRW